MIELQESQAPNISCHKMTIIFIVYRMLHIFLAQDFDSLKRLLQIHENTTKFDPIDPNKLYGLHVWIIHVVGEKRRENLLEVLKKSSLEFNSHVFEFFESNQGKYISDN